MTSEEYSKITININIELAQIAERTIQMAKTSCANSDNPEFNRIMDRHVELTNNFSKAYEELCKG